jgi:hypothetical protein
MWMCGCRTRPTCEKLDEGVNSLMITQVEKTPN